MANPLAFMFGLFSSMMKSRAKAVDRDIDHFAEVEHYDTNRNRSL
ncbi:hypothetical protein [Maritalea porphyrae]|nr:hypothetical protein [Maritalea porphyrae]MCZ4272592.1 hypothetical protein [Maritalea porphyrae]